MLPSPLGKPAPSQETLRLGFIGLGVQGAQIARHYLARSGSLLVHDLRQEAMSDFAAGETSATSVASLADLAKNCDVIGICVVDDTQLESLFLESDGLFDLVGAGTVLIVHSTVSPDLILRLAANASCKNVDIVDAPVSGGAVARRPMSFMVGGGGDAVRRCLPILGEVDVNVTLTGETGTGAAAKLAHQIILCGNLLAAREGMAFASAFGIPSSVMRQIARLGSAQSSVSENWSNDQINSHTINLLLKDLEICLSTAEAAGVLLIGTEAARTSMKLDMTGE